MIWSIFQIVPSHLCLILRKKASFESFVNRWCTCFTSLHWRIFQSPHLRGVHPDKQNDANVRAPKISKKKASKGLERWISEYPWIFSFHFIDAYTFPQIDCHQDFVSPWGIRCLPFCVCKARKFQRSSGDNVDTGVFFSREGWFFPGFGWWKKSTINFWMSEIVWKFHIFLSREDLESCKEVRILVNLAEKRTSGNCFFWFFLFHKLPSKS